MILLAEFTPEEIGLQPRSCTCTWCRLTMRQNARNFLDQRGQNHITLLQDEPIITCMHNVIKAIAFYISIK